MKEGDDVRVHMSEFFDTIDKLWSLEIDINKELQAIMLLYSLPESYENFRCAIESRDSLPKPEDLKIKIIEEADARKTRNSDNRQNAMLLGNKFKRGDTEKLEESTKQHSGNPKLQFKYRCHRCRKVGHKAADCKSKRSYPIYRETSKVCVENKSAGRREEIALVQCGDKYGNNWCIDSGCTSHMSMTSANFIKLENVNKVLHLANGEATKIEGTGTVKVIAKHDEGEKVLKLENVMYVPDLHTNLLSVSKITDRGYRLHFDRDCAVILNSNGEKIAVADRRGDLYFLRAENECANMTLDNNEYTDFKKWHLKLGHLNPASMLEMERRELIDGLKLGKIRNFSYCETCIKAKQCEIPFPKSEEVRTTEVLEIIHSDICGPLQQLSIGGARYFVVFIDDKTRWCEVRFLKKKSDVFEAFKEYKALVETQTGKRIRCLQTDNGTEYLSREFETFLKHHGIRRRLTVPHTPQQNGVAERKNRTLIETARSLMIHSGVSPGFWAEAVNTANYVRNRCISKAINGDTPFRLWTGRKPCVSYFQIFGSKVFVLDKRPTKQKLDSRSIECIFLGYSTESKAYRVWDIKERKVIISRNVKFTNEVNINGDYEECFPDILKNNEQNSNMHEQANEEKSTDIEIQLNHNEILQMQMPQEHLSDKNSTDADESRLAGRPRLVRTGQPGRPRKVYRIAKMRTDADDSEYESANFLSSIDPCDMNEAVNGPNAEEWKSAILKEYLALVRSGTWEILDKPQNRNIIGSKFVFTTKYKADGSIDKRKARLVARGFSQQNGIDYNETYAPVAKASSIRLLMALSVEYDMEVHQMDVVTAYLNGEVEEEIWMEQPDGMEENLRKIISMFGKETNTVETARRWLTNLKDGHRKACLLKKSLYGLKQSGRQWYRKLDKYLKEIGMERTNIEPCIYIRRFRESVIIIAVYVDDLLLASNDETWLAETKRNLRKFFEMKDLGKINYCLGIQFCQSANEITMHQSKYIQEILTRFNMSDCKPVSTPLDANTSLQRPNENEHRDFKCSYQNLVGSLMYLATSTRPDIAYTVSLLSQYNNNYAEEHWKAAKRVLRYLKDTRYYGLRFRKTDGNITGFVDADWGGSLDDRKSYSGYSFLMSGCSISWESRKQRSTALSSTEAEYIAISEATKEALYLKNFLAQLGFPGDRIIIYNDNQGAQKLVKNPVTHSRTKHIDIRYHFVREAYEDGFIGLEYMPTSEMPADILTKALQRSKHDKCRISLGVTSVAESKESDIQTLRGGVGVYKDFG